MSLKIFSYKVNFHNDLLRMLRDYLVFTGEAISKAPWHHEIEIDKHLKITLDNLGDFSPPKGDILIGTFNDVPAGTATIKMIRPGVAELKRMYLPPEFQGKKIGEALLVQSINAAKELGAKQILLDTPPPFKPAHGLYQKFGFEFCDEYPEVGIPDDLKINWLYMSKFIED